VTEPTTPTGRALAQGDGEAYPFTIRRIEIEAREGLEAVIAVKDERIRKYKALADQLVEALRLCDGWFDIDHAPAHVGIALRTALAAYEEARK